MKKLLKTLIPKPCVNAIRSALSCTGKALEFIPKDAIILAHPKKQVFFGYYDITPFSADNQFILAQHAPHENVSPHTTHPDLELGYYDLHNTNPVFIPFAKTKTWNWQQGCRLQWYRHKEDQNTNCVIFNVYENGHYTAIIQNIFSGQIMKRLPLAIYALSPDGSFALSLDFDRLHDCRAGYGYNLFPDTPRQDIIQHIDIVTGQIKTIMSMADIIKTEPLPSMENALHYFNHLSISPSGKRYMVTHLWVTPSGKRYTRFIVSNPADQNAPYLCPNNSGHTSHYCWLNDDKVMVFGSQSEHKNRYYLYDLITHTSSIIGQSNLTQDGHPTWANHTNLITDTYPDYKRQQHLLRYNTQTNTLKTIASFHVPINFTGEVRCDLHPRLNNTADQICIDIVRHGRRAVCILNYKTDPKQAI